MHDVINIIDDDFVAFLNQKIWEHTFKNGLVRNANKKNLLLIINQPSKIAACVLSRLGASREDNEGTCARQLYFSIDLGACHMEFQRFHLTTRIAKPKNPHDFCRSNNLECVRFVQKFTFCGSYKAF